MKIKEKVYPCLKIRNILSRFLGIFKRQSQRILLEVDEAIQDFIHTSLVYLMSKIFI